MQRAIHSPVSRATLRLCTTVEMSTSAITCARMSPPGNATIYRNACNTRTVRTFIRHACRAHSIVDRHSPGLKCRCREAKNVITRYSRRVLRNRRSSLRVVGLSVPQSQPFPQATSPQVSYARQNSAEASGQLNRLEYVFSLPGILVGCRP